MHPGRELRRLRERRGWSIATTATAVGISAAYLSRIERQEREPTWSVLERIAALWDLQPVLAFAASAARAASDELARLTPAQRLSRQGHEWLIALLRSSAVMSGFAVTGAAAAVAHGVDVPIQRLELLVIDEDEHVAALIEALRLSLSMPADVMPEAYRRRNRQEWVLFDVDAHVTLVSALPPVMEVPLESRHVMAVTLPTLMANDVRVSQACGSD